MTNINLSWTKPTTRKNGGGPLAASEIAYFRLFQSIDGGPMTQYLQVPGVNTSSSITSVSPGTYLFELAAIDTNGQEGDRIQHPAIVVPAAPALPNPPSAAPSFTVTLS